MYWAFFYFRKIIIFKTFFQLIKVNQIFICKFYFLQAFFKISNSEWYLVRKEILSKCYFSVSYIQRTLMIGVQHLPNNPQGDCLIKRAEAGEGGLLVPFSIIKVVLLTLGVISLKRSIAGAYAVSFRILSKKNDRR